MADVNPNDCTVNNTCAPASAINVAGFPTEQVDNFGYRFWLTLVILVICSGFFVAARIGTRLKMKQMGADDYFILAAMASLLTQSSLWANAVRQGYGSDYLSIDAHQRQEFLKYWWLGNVFFPITSYLYKSSVLLLNQRIFVQKPFQITCWCIFAANTCWFLGNWFALVFQCLPIPSMWGAAVATKCIEFNDLWISLVSWSVSMDVIILSLPLPMIWKLHLKIADKLMLMGLFMLGAIVVVCSLMTCSAIVDGIKVNKESTDHSYTFALANLFEVIESNIGVIGSCLPILRILLTQWFPEWFATKKSTRKNYYDQGWSNEYALQNVSNKQKDARQYPRHNTSVTGGDLFKSGARKSDELGIISESWESADKESRYETDTESAGRAPHAIKKNVSYSIQRF